MSVIAAEIIINAQLRCIPHAKILIQQTQSPERTVQGASQ